MIRSKLADPWLDADLDGGWHAMEDNSWRWTERCFAVRLNSAAYQSPTLRFRFTAAGPVRIKANIDGVELPESEFTAAGQHTYAQPISQGGHVSIRFELDRTLDFAGDRRELGVQVKFWSYDEPVPRALSPITITES
jgi:hypothetical protein